MTYDSRIMLETWEAGAKFRADPRGNWQAIDVAKFLGWVTSQRVDGSPRLSNTARACSAAHSLIQGGYAHSHRVVDGRDGSFCEYENVEDAKAEADRLNAEVRKKRTGTSSTRAKGEIIRKVLPEGDPPSRGAPQRDLSEFIGIFIA